MSSIPFRCDSEDEEPGGCWRQADHFLWKGILRAVDGFQGPPSVRGSCCSKTCLLEHSSCKEMGT